MADVERKAVIVTRRTRREELVARFNTASQARFYIEHSGGDFDDIEREATAYAEALATVRDAVGRFGRIQVVERSLLPTFIFGPDDVVIAVGQDGVVANTMKYLTGQPLLGVNPDPLRFDGILLQFEPADLARVYPEVLAGRRPSRSVTMAKATLADGQVLLAVNDLFIGPRSHTSARYELTIGDRHELQSSSGIIVSTGLGSTAWLKSIVTGSCAIARSLGARIDAAEYRPTPWDAPFLQFAVREPFPSVSTGVNLLCGRADASTTLRVRSLMPDYGVIFSDGLESDFVAFNSGAVATIGVAERQGRLVH